jgi:pimeloyl-ACP methyl ester carboxylesterase
MMALWIFLRGLMRESRHWGDFPEAFRSRNSGAELVVPDLPGNGALHGLPSPMRVEDMVECYRQALLAQGSRPPYYLLALSLGAMVAVAWAQRYPAEVSGCVLMNTSLRPFNPFYRRLRPRNYASLLRLALLNKDVEWRERLIWRMTSSRSEAEAGILSAWIRYQRECPISRRNAMAQLIAAIRYRAPRHRPPVPMLILASALDGLVHPLCSRRLAEQWQTDFAMHPSAGHDLPLDDGAWIAARVRNWLQANGS